MTLVGPVLDDRTYAQLRDELVARIPVYAPEWTDHNESDPGIALLELFAYLGESLLFRFNQIPEATQVAFLRLLGVQPRPAQIASTLLVLSTDVDKGVSVPTGSLSRAGATEFSTRSEVVAWPLEAHAMGKRAAGPLPTDPAAAAAEKRRREHAVAWLPSAAQAAAAANPPVYYETEHVPVEPTAPGAEPLDVAATVDGALWVALVGDALPDAGRSIFLGVAIDTDVDPHPFALERAASGDFTADTLRGDPPAVDWELWHPPSARAPYPFTALSTPADSTRGLTVTGVVMIDLPPGPRGQQGDNGEGGIDAPPRLDDPKLAARVVGWLRARRPAHENDAIHRVRWVGLNAVDVDQARTATPELLGVGTGEPGQTFRLVGHPVLVGSTRLQVEEDGGWRSWTEVDGPATLALADENARPFTVDPTTGTVRFGGTRTRVPQAGERVRVLSYRVGGGAAGNVPAKALSPPNGFAVKGTNVLPATGGRDAPTLDEVLEEVPVAVHRRDRAVTPEDVAALAGEVAGVARAETLARFHPDTPTQPAAGVVTVVVFPTEDRRRPGAPEPDLDLLRRVVTYLEPRRLVTTELYVVPPTYRRIALSVGVEVEPGHPIDAVRRWVALILRQFLAPLPPYGPDGQGWDLGRTVGRNELAAVATQVEGVRWVRELRLGLVVTAAAGTTGTTVTEADEVRLEKWEVPEVVAVAVVPGDPPPPSVEPPPPPGGGPVLVPLPPDVC
ncbi:putative baseplate assembly protein [Actinomycetospora lemnae]|uniref:Baseplate assembly protein n=1 Tax=Actinomycetospora lemnae TaxID=3019891 RepID=A0ABT5SRL5_9PSEU|nr:putative baseplate assembly protein [Actinomycetospora sp. DW7H6]MDD7965490.1 putative baseplate assembly protein [Actinomycetospora sp. DW7H6]